MDYKSVIESRYNREAWEALLHDIFLSGANFRTTPIPVDAHSPLVSESLQLGTITLKDDNKIAVYEIKLSDSVDIVENRVGIRNLLFSDWKFKGCAGAFIFCYRDNESVLRFSYVSQTFAFGEDGKMAKEETDTKRFTYILGEGHRSRTAIGQFENLKSSSQTLKDLTKAFSLDAVSDRFFDDYKEVYEDIVEYVTGKRYVKVANKWEEKVIHAPNEILMAEFSWYEDPEKTVRDYVKRLMSRIVFLQFIQKKGWLGVPIDKEWGEGDKEFLQHLYEKYDNKDNFIDGILELLFDDINHKRENDLANFMLGRDIKVPYLNGGLFERDSVDERSFRLPRNLMDKMMNFFSSYNFTIDENDPDDAEIGVDPEMLGRIFENLLEDNKDKGAFYTPKEIVQYMCQESLIAYLQKEKSDADAEAIRTFVTTYDATVLNDDLKQDIDAKLKNVKICDPAIGSGAFPMGLLKELFTCRSAIEGLSQDNAAEIKKHIIQNNIYGVDIESGAVEIARLRFWLAIIVDEKTPHTLPNMDFKIMQGNSLIPTFEGNFVNLTDKQRHINSSKIAECKKQLYELQRRYYLAESSTKNNLMIQIKYLILEIIKLQMDYEKRYEEQINAFTPDLFGIEDNNPHLDSAKNQVISSCINMQEALHSKNSSTNELASISLPFFDWRIMFPDVFTDSNRHNGFDIVIANPPYLFLSGKGSPVRRLLNEGRKEAAERLRGLLDLYAQVYPEVSSGCRDFYKWFYKLGVSICSEGGILTYITPDTYFNMPKYRDLREVLFCNQVSRLIDLGFSVFDAPTVSSSIILLIKDGQLSRSVLYSDIKHTLNKSNRYLLKSLVSECEREIPISDYELCAYKHPIANKIYSSSSYSTLNHFLTFTEGEHNIQISLQDALEYATEGYVPVLVDSEMERNFYVRKAYVKSSLSANSLHNGPRLILRKTGDYLFASIPYDFSYAIAHQNVYVVKAVNQTDDMKFWLGVLNSKLITFLYQTGLYGQKGRTMAQFRIYALNALPAPQIIDKGIRTKITSLTESLLMLQSGKLSKEKESTEFKIDELVFQLYGISDKESKEIIAYFQ